MYKESQYSRLQRSISYFLIFTIFFVNSFQVSFFDKTWAEWIKNIELISVIVYEKVYDSLKSRINRYAEDVQAKLNNTKVLIYKVPEDITPQKIAALNEKLFYEWDWSNDSSKLVWTVLVWDFPLPVIHDSDKTFLSVYPYIDFNEKNFVYNNTTGFYERSTETPTNPNPEIWHSIIAPNTWDDSKDKIKLIDFFDKDHDYYTKSWVFSSSLKDPYVFYYDGKRDEETATYSLRKWYELYIKNIEDISYNRFNKYLAQKISDAFYANTAQELSGALLNSWQESSELQKLISSNLWIWWLDVSAVPDALTKNIISKVTKQFFQIFNEKYIWDILKFVYNTWRYGNTNNTRVDTIISLVSKRDNWVKRILKDSNGVLEGYIDSILKKWVARNIAIPVKVEEAKHYRYSVTTWWWWGEWGWWVATTVCNNTSTEWEWYSTKEYKSFEPNDYVWVLENFYNWLVGNNIKTASDCSIYRWTQRTTDNKSVMVEATKAQNMTQAQIKADTTLLQTSPDAQTCFGQWWANTMWFWWGYSIFNLSADWSWTTLKLGPTDYRRATKPIYVKAWWLAIWYNNSSDVQDDVNDIAWKKVQTSSVNSCLKFNWMYTNPDNLSPSKSQCNNKMSEHVAPYPFTPYTWDTFEDLYKNNSWKVYFSTDYDAQNSYIYLDNKLVKSHIWDNWWCDKFIIHSKYYYKKVLWVVEHKSPTDEEFWAQLVNMTTPSLPSDKNRYVDFMSAKWNEIKFEYPNLYRIRILDTKNLNYDYVKLKVKEYLDSKSEEFNKILASENPNSLGWPDKEIYDSLKVDNANYPTSIDFYSLISQDSKVLDEVVKNVLWININSTALKYKYVLENYLDIDWNTESLDIWHKSDYEIAYLWSKWDAANMYLWIDLSKPKDDSDSTNAAKNAIAKYSTLKNFLSANKITLNSWSSEFKCWPADGVPIFQWMSAIMCRLKTLVPPIAIQGWSCSSKTLWIWSSDWMSTDFGWEFPKISNPIYNEDKDNNWIPDGAELINNWKISLISDKTMYYYNNSARIKANLFYDDKLIWVDSTSKVSFDLVRLVSRKDKTPEVIFDARSDDYESKKDIIASYINFTPVQVRVKEWVANYAFSAWSEDVDAVFTATIKTLDKNQKVAVYKKSNELTVKIRGYHLEIASIINWTDTSNLRAWSATSINFQIKTFNKDNEQVTNNEPIYLNVYNDDTQEKIQDEATYDSSNFQYSSDILKKTWNYKFVFRDSLWIEQSQIITVTNAWVKEIKLTPSSTQIVKWNIVDILAELKDSYWNIPKWDFYNITWTITWDWVFDSNWEKQLKASVLDWFYNFRMRSTDGAWNIQIKFSVDSEQAESSILTINVVDYAKTKLSIDDPSNIIVWKDKHKINLEVVDWNNNLLSNFNWVAYFDFNELNWVISPNYVKIEHWKPTKDIYLIPNFVAARNLIINTTVPWVDDVEWNKVTILPDKPMYVWLQNSKPKLEAKDWNSSKIKAALYDRYSNIVFNDSSHKINFYIQDEDKKFVNLWWDTYSKEAQVTDWETSIWAYATNIPWSAYIIAQAIPSLENNTVTIKSEENEELTASWVSENAVLFNSYYLFNKDKLEDINYNALYTVLQWANYWDITHPGYLAWEMLFNKWWRSLAVSSTINNSSTRQHAFWFTPGWKFIANEWSSNDTFSLESSINSNSNGTAINLYESVYKDLIARVWLNFDNDTELVDCWVGNNSDIWSCNVPTNSSYILLKWINWTNIRKNSSNIELYLNNFKIFDIDKNWRINKDPWITVELDSNSSWNMLWMKLLMNKEQIGYLWMKFKTDRINVFDSEAFPNILYENKNQIVIEKISNEYYFDTTFLWISSHWAKWVEFYRESDTDSENADKSLITNWDKTWLEQYNEQAWIWWEWKNKMLLEFAWWNTIWDSTKFYQTFSMVNLWDPVVSLETKSQANSDFDKSIWKRLTEEKWSSIESYKKIDFNWDKADDLVVFYEDWHIELLANYNWNLKNMWYLAYLSDAWKLRKSVWDFSWDWFDDIVFVDKNWQLGLLNNTWWKFSRQRSVILNEAWNQEVFIDWQIEQLEVFDMDKDGKDDIVTVDDSWDLSILYWTFANNKYPWKLVFNKKVIDTSLWLKLKTDSVKTGWAIYYDSLPQLPDFTTQSQYLLQSQELQNTVGNWNVVTSNDATLWAMVNRLVYYQEKYTDYQAWSWVTEQTREQAILNTIWTDENWQPNTALAQEISESQNDLVISNWSWLTDISSVNSSAIEKTKTFLRSQYWQAHNLDISKTYKDTNSWKLQAWDIIEVNIKITNNSTKKLNDIIYYDTSKNFEKSWDNPTYTISTSSINETRPLISKTDSEFDNEFNNFSLNPNETANIKYNLVMPNVSFWLITVWLLEKNDSYWDVALNPTNSCWWDQLIWASIAQRDYKKWKRTFADTSKLPGELEKNKVDNNDNGIPDYIDELNWDPTWTWAQNYSQDKLNELNKDSNGNWIPDKDEQWWNSVFSYNWDSWWVETTWLNVSNFDQIDSTIDTIVNWLGCWFWWWACISSPLNWAPLAPWSDPTLFWMPIWDWLKVSEWLPIFSAVNWIKIGKACVPMPWPPAMKWIWCFGNWAWGRLWTWSPTNVIRVFVTPTITWAVWTAICWWWPPAVAWNIPPPWLSPAVPGWNCVIAAVPLGCNNDWSDWNIWSQWISYWYGNKYFNAASCNKTTTWTWVSEETQNQIINYIKWDLSQAKSIMNTPSVQHGSMSSSNEPIIGMWSSWWSWDWDSLDVSFDSSALKNMDFWNVVKVDFKRVSSFPDFIMDWATRQIEEIANKLVTLPTLKIILPDFSWITDSWWGNFWEKYREAKNKLAQKEAQENSKKEAENAKEQAKTSNISNDTLRWAQDWMSQQKKTVQNSQVVTKTKEWISWAKAAYEVISNLPLIKLDQEQVNIDIPRIWPEEIDKWIKNAEKKLKEYKATYEKTKQSWGKFKDDPAAAASFKALLDADKLIKSVEKNIKILNEYKKFPTKFRKYITWKEMYLNQILCNLEIINKVTGWRIKDNWKRFKTWVQLIVLLKAILKSWQLIIDVFADFNSNCAVCHNERYNLKYSITKMVSAIVPKLPIIVFPKWPDIIIDLHNIRAWLNINLPEFSFKVKPIVLPQLPDLVLPDTPSLNASFKLSLPSIWTLPDLPALPDLPELPSLPSVKLPDLPPPPKIPKMFGIITAMLNLLKLISKIFCLWNKFWSLFPPEWRAWDTIAWMTERTWTSLMDKLFIDMPNIAISFIDAIKVTSFVNLEFDASFITEMAKSTLEPFNKFSNDLSNINKWTKIPTIDLNSIVPKIDDINIEAKPNVWKPGAYNNSKVDNEKLLWKMAWILVWSMLNMSKTLQDNSSKWDDIEEFKKSLKKSIETLALSDNSKEKQIYNELTKAIDYNSSNEDKYINELSNQNNKKFDDLKDIIKELQIKNNELNKELQQIENWEKSIKDFSPIKNSFWWLKVVANNKDDKLNQLTKNLEKNDDKFLASISKLNSYYNDKQAEEIQKQWNDIVNKLKAEASKYSISDDSVIQSQTWSTSIAPNFATTNNTSSNLDYSYNYEWIYVTSATWKQTRLIDYLDEIDSKSNVVEFDVDWDWDLDTVYYMGWAIYFKENLSKQPNKIHISWVDWARDISDINDYLWISSTETNIPFAPNYFEEIMPEANTINFRFASANKNKEKAFRLEYYDYIERFDATNNTRWYNKWISPFARLNLVDMFTTSNWDDIIKTSDSLNIRNNFATIDSWVWIVNAKIPGYKILNSWDSLSIQSWKTIYSWIDGLTIKYKYAQDNNYKVTTVWPKMNVEFMDTADVTILNWSMYLIYNSIEEYSWDIANLRWMPVLPWLEINWENKNVYFNIAYSWNQILTVENWAWYRALSLWGQTEMYYVSIETPNGFYYWKMYSIDWNKRSTITDLTLLSPQLEADNEVPLVSLEDGIRIPVYTQKVINLKKYITDVSGIKEIYIDADIEKDSSWDWVVDNDKDSLDEKTKYWIKKWDSIYDIIVWSFDKLISKNILLTVIDNNNNKLSSLIDFEVYSPIPQISNVDKNISQIKWSIDENIAWEPIDIFRYRDWVLKKIDTKNEKDETTSDWWFDITWLSIEKGLVITKSTTSSWVTNTWVIAIINETTWRINIKDYNYQVKVTWADSNNKTKIEIINITSWETIFSENLSLLSNQNISQVTDFAWAQKWIYFLQGKKWFNLVKNSSDTPYLKNWAYITDSNKKWIVWISDDWNVYLLDNNYSLVYDNYGDNIVIKILDSGQNTVWYIMYKVDIFYILK